MARLMGLGVPTMRTREAEADCAAGTAPRDRQGGSSPFSRGAGLSLAHLFCFIVREFVEAVRAGGPPPIDVYDAVTWSSIMPLSAESIRGGGKPVEIPDFTRGK